MVITVCTVYTVYTVYIVCTVYTVYTVCTFCYKFIIKRAVCCKLITRHAVCRNLLTDAAGLLRNAQFVRIAKDHIRPPRLYSSRRFAANRNNQPKKKNPDDAAL